MKRYRVGVLGATGFVGQRLIQLLDGHPWFTLTEVVASQRSATRTYAEVVPWRLPSGIPEGASDLVVKDLGADLDYDLLLSALDSTVAGKQRRSSPRPDTPS